MPSLIGNKPNQVPSNGDLGTLAFQDASNVLVGNINATGVTTVQAGTASAPAITTTGDTNTGIFFPAADTIAFAEGGAEVARFDSSGNLGIGTTSPASIGGGYTTLDIRGSSGGGLRFGISSSTNGVMYTDSLGLHLYTASSIPLRFYNNDTERMRIDTSGNLLVGTTSASAGNTFGNGILVRGATKPFAAVTSASSGECAVGIGRSASTGNYIEFYYNTALTTFTGGISTDGSSTAYNTTSDYRLKENIAPMTGALAKVAQLKPVTYTWKESGSSGQGFIAHELQEVAPDCVTGEKDAVDADGNPIHQGIDTSFLVATLTAAIQEQQAIITDLKSRIETLESTQG